MSIKHSIANKKRWAKFSKEELSKKMSAMAKAKQKKLTPAQKRAHAFKMLKARNKKTK